MSELEENSSNKVDESVEKKEVNPQIDNNQQEIDDKPYILEFVTGELKSKIESNDGEIKALTKEVNKNIAAFAEENEKMNHLYDIKRSLEQKMRAVTNFLGKVKNNFFGKRFFKDIKELPEADEER